MSIQSGVTLPNRRRGLGAYTFAFLSVLSALCTRQIFFADALEAEATFAFFYVSTIIAAWYGGLGPGLVTTALGALISAYLYLGPLHTIYDLETQVKLGLFLFSGILYSFLFAYLNNAKELLNREVEQRKKVEVLLRDADAMKDRFLATLAHELRNPLAPIRNCVAILRDSNGDPGKMGDTLAIIDRQVSQVVRLVEDLLDAERVRHNKLILRKEKMLLGDAIQGALESVRPSVALKSQSLSVSIPPEPIWIDGDLTRLLQVFTNVLSNASRYTQPQGSLHLAVWKEGNNAVVVVRDNGMGIPAESMSRLFDMFAQDEKNIGKGGLGIGLHLVKRLVEMHGGNVAACSEGPGMGSEFRIVLPTTEKPTETSAKLRAPGELRSHDSVRVMVVDDDLDSTVTMQRLLKSAGYDVRTAKDGPTAFEAVQSFTPQFILLDIGLPGMDGYQVCQKLHEIPSLKDTVIIAQTGHGQADARRRTKQVGFDDHLVKPVDLEDLQHVVERHLPPVHLRTQPPPKGSDLERPIS